MVYRLNRFVILLITAIAGLVAFWIGGYTDKGDLENTDWSEFDDVFEFDKFKLTGVEETIYRNGSVTTTIFADQVLHRHRQSGSIIFYNLNEIYVKNLELSLNALGEPPLQVLFSDFPELSSLGSLQSATKRKEIRSVAPSAEQNVVTRIVADGFKLKIVYDTDRVARISGDMATFTTADQNIVFEGNVSIEDTVGRHFIAPQAIWSTRQEGVLFAQGYTEQDSNLSNKQSSGFFALDQSGILTEVKKLPAVRIHQDIVDQLENLLWTHLFQQMFGEFQ